MRSLVARGHRVTLLTSNRAVESAASGGPVRVIVGSIADAAACVPAFDDVHAVVYCAGASVPASVAGPGQSIAQMVAPVEAMAAAAAVAGVPRFLFLSSGGTVYGEPDVVPVPENHPLRPVHTYAKAKVQAEAALAALRVEGGIETVSLRCANPYGEGQLPWRGQGVVATLFAAARSGKVMPFFGDGRSVRDYIHVADVADAIADLLHCEVLPFAVNVGTGVGTELLELVGLVEALCGREIRLDRRPAPATDVGRIVLDVALLRSLIRFDPIDLRSGLSTLEPEPALSSTSG